MGRAPTYEVGDRIGPNLEIQQILGGEGRSGMGVVYVVYDHEQRVVRAWKTFQDRFLSSPEAREAFRQEAVKWIRLDRHSNIVVAQLVFALTDWRTAREKLYIQLEYIAPDEQGRNTLRHYLGGARLPLERVLHWAIQFCYAMEHANARGIACHRDIKPDNVMIAPGSCAGSEPGGMVKITDFGLARAAELAVVESGLQRAGDEESPRLSLSHMGGKAVCGTPGYMAPEVVRGEGADVRSDVYSFGLVLWQMAAGSRRPPFAADWRGDVETYVQETYERQMREAPPRTEGPVWPVIQHCLERERQERYPDFAALRAEMERMVPAHRGEVVVSHNSAALTSTDWHWRGDNLMKLGELEEAIACFDLALKMNSGDVFLWLDKGNALVALGRCEEAICCYDQALLTEPGYGLLWFYKGRALDALGRPEEAISCYEQAVQIDPGDRFSWFHRGDALAGLGRWREAISCYEQALQADPRYADAWLRKAAALVALGEAEEALSCYDQVLEIAPHYSTAWREKALVLRAMGRPADERAAWRGYLEGARWHASEKQSVAQAEARLRELEGRLGS